MKSIAIGSEADCRFVITHACERHAAKSARGGLAHGHRFTFEVKLRGLMQPVRAETTGLFVQPLIDGLDSMAKSQIGDARVGFGGPPFCDLVAVCGKRGHLLWKGRLLGNDAGPTWEVDFTIADHQSSLPRLIAETRAVIEEMRDAAYEATAS